MYSTLCVVLLAIFSLDFANSHNFSLPLCISNMILCLYVPLLYGMVTAAPIHLSIYLFIRLSVCYFIFIFYHNMCHIIIHSFYILMYHICNNYYCAQFFYSNNETAWEMVIIALQKQQT